ncbi:MAG TPA: carboxypeptidase-like regulatory domain-containing protein [Chthoniobacterales bacterium]|nr:carboxypeptidase-like regulatory domain-containing protein [Chthoniobacterales bacterium]
MKQRITDKTSVRRAIRLVVLITMLFARNLVAQTSTVEGTVKDPNGRPLGGADVRVELKNGNGGRQVRSDARGHYVVDGLAPGKTYRVTLLINGSVKASINNVLAKSGATQLNFDLRTGSVAGNHVVVKNGKRYVYIPSETGSHLGGRWVEVDENGQADSVGVNNVERAGSEALRRMQSNSGAVGEMGGSGR